MKTNKNNLTVSIFETVAILAFWYCAGVAPDFRENINSLYQYLPVEVISDYGLSTFKYLHSQPPLLNFLIYLIVKIFGVDWVGDGVYVLMISVFFLNILIINKILECLDLNYVFGLVFLLYPAFIAYHTWFYEPAISLLLVNATILLLIVKPSVVSWLMLASVQMLQVLLHSSFNILIVSIWLLAVFFVFYSQKLSKSYLLVIIVSMIIPVSHYLNNMQLTGGFMASSWAGCNLAQMWPTHPLGFAFKPADDDSVPDIVGKASLNGRPNYNNLEFGKHCNQTLQEIRAQAADKKILSEYLIYVSDSIIKNEGKLSIDYRCCGFESKTWGSVLTDYIVKTSELVKYRSFFYLLMIFCPMFSIFLLFYKRNKFYKQFVCVLIIYLVSFAVIHMANGGEQERMQFKFSFYIYICSLYAIMQFIRSKSRSKRN